MVRHGNRAKSQVLKDSHMPDLLEAEDPKDALWTATKGTCIAHSITISAGAHAGLISHLLGWVAHSERGGPRKCYLGAPTAPACSVSASIVSIQCCLPTAWLNPNSGTPASLLKTHHLMLHELLLHIVHHITQHLRSRTTPPPPPPQPIPSSRLGAYTPAVIATIGPAVHDVDTLVQLLEAGVTCCRIDFTVSLHRSPAFWDSAKRRGKGLRNEPFQHLVVKDGKLG